MEWILGLWLGCMSGVITGLVGVIFIRTARFAKVNLEMRMVSSKVGNGTIPSQALALLRNRSLVVENLPLLGVGGLAKVYDATLPGGFHVAIKSIPVEDSSATIHGSPVHSSWWSTRSSTRRAASRQPGKDHAVSELEILRKTRHPNVTRIYAYIRTPKAYLLACQLAENGSLQDVLSKVRQGAMSLNWPTRSNIALGIARGLEYLHCECIPSVVHRDLKPSNILLDDKFAARLSDFGLASEMANDHLTVSHVVGTAGYFAPEYTSTGIFHKASDVYSMGVVFYVLLCGKEPRDEFFRDVEGGMLGWMSYLLDSQQEHRSLDSTMPRHHADTEELKETMMLLRVAYHCTRTKPGDRPKANEVVKMLLDSFKLCRLSFPYT